MLTPRQRMMLKHLAIVNSASTKDLENVLGTKGVGVQNVGAALERQGFVIHEEFNEMFGVNTSFEGWVILQAGRDAIRVDAQNQVAQEAGPTIQVPEGTLDLLRFMCQTWAAIDDWAYTHAGDAIDSYPVVQGTSLQFALRQLGEDAFDPQKARAALAELTGRKL